MLLILFKMDASKIEIDVNKSIDYSSMGITHEHTNFDTFKEGGWEFFNSNRKMFSSKELDTIEPTMKLKKLPDMFYGFNRLLILNKTLDVLIDFNAIDMLNFASYAERNENLNKSVINLSCKDTKELVSCFEKMDLNKEQLTNLKTIYYLPSEQKVQFAEKWKSLKLERDDIEKREPTFDWTFSTPYMGTVGYLSENVICKNGGKSEKSHKLVVLPTNEEIPLNKLGPENPILNYSDVRFFDDELNDSGHCTGNIRYFY